MLNKKCESVKKQKKYYCDVCDYNASQKGHYTKHLATDNSID